MSLKSLIQRLLDSRTTPSEAGHNAMPSSAPTTISSPTSITSWGTIATFTAPDDGYVTFRGRSMVGSAAQIASLPLENNPTIITATQDNYQGMSCNLPVVKGKTIEVYGSNIENIDVYFNRLIGGGYSILLWRALSCLRPSFNYLPRSFCEASILTLLINADQVPVHKARQSQETARRISWLHSQVGLSLRLAQKVRQTTHGLGLKTPPEELHTSPMQFANTKRLLSQCKKEIFLLLTSALITRTKAPFCLSLLKQQNNLRTGGALC